MGSLDPANGIIDNEWCVFVAAVLCGVFMRALKACVSLRVGHVCPFEWFECAIACSLVLGPPPPSCLLSQAAPISDHVDSGVVLGVHHGPGCGAHVGAT